MIPRMEAKKTQKSASMTHKEDQYSTRALNSKSHEYPIYKQRKARTQHQKLFLPTRGKTKFLNKKRPS